MYLLGNISENEYRDKSAELQRMIADLSKEPAPKETKFDKNWKELYEMLDEKHRQSFWRNLIKGIRIDKDAMPIEILY